MGIVLRPYMWSALLKSLQQSLLLHSLFLGLHFFRQAAIIDVKVLIIFLEIDVDGEIAGLRSPQPQSLPQQILALHHQLLSELSVTN